MKQRPPLSLENANHCSYSQLLRGDCGSIDEPKGRRLGRHTAKVLLQ